MKRRSFLKTSSLLTAPAMIGGVPISAFKPSKMSALLNGESDRVLVLIQLNGGNDGLNTVIPMDQYDGLIAVRPDIYIPSRSAIILNDKVGLHPEMSGVKTLYDNAELNIIQGVAYPDQNRSHFRSLDIWHSGSQANEYLSTGWLGRYMDSKFPNYPNDYPNAECTDPFALTIGGVISETCQGISGNFSLTISDPEDLNQLTTPINNELANGCGKTNLDFMVKSIEQTNEYSTIVQERYSQGNNLSDKYRDDDALATKLKTVAKLISGGLKTKIYVVSIGGFDTHANQTVGGDPTSGEHATLLSSLSESICAFQEDLRLLGIDKRVLGMTYSEFGRRIRANDSLGTDHGTAGPLLVFGTCVNAGITGDNPEVHRDVSNSEGVPMQHDFRSVYGSVLMDWFDAKESEIKSLFNHDFQYIPIANTCNTTSTQDKDILKEKLNLVAYPNPFDSHCQITFDSEGGWTKLSVFDALGSEVHLLSNRKLVPGSHRINFEAHHLASGTYFIRLQTKEVQKVIRVVKV